MTATQIATVPRIRNHPLLPLRTRAAKGQRRSLLADALPRRSRGLKELEDGRREVIRVTAVRMTRVLGVDVDPVPTIQEGPRTKKGGDRRHDDRESSSVSHGICN